MFITPYNYGNQHTGSPVNLNIDKKSSMFKNDWDNSSNLSSTSGKSIKVYFKTPDMLYSGGNGTGLSFFLKYAEESTTDDPVIYAKGVDEKGNEFEQTVSVNNIDPSNATYVEMRALEAHNHVYYGIMKMSSLPLESGQMALHDRRNFFDMYKEGIKNFNTLKRYDLSAVYEQCYQSYLDIAAGQK